MVKIKSIERNVQLEKPRVDARPQRRFVVAMVKDATRPLSNSLLTAIFLDRHSVDSKTGIVKLVNEVSLEELDAMVTSQEVLNYDIVHLEGLPAFNITSESNGVEQTVVGNRRSVVNIGNLTEEQLRNQVLRGIAQRGQFANPQHNIDYLTAGVVTPVVRKKVDVSNAKQERKQPELQENS